ncbi:hypothetical protein QBC41DRAFT_392823 [Cercophora samala]|uniref:Uncharacterized protein n=1 Tax=Cercophora samala TaxID=330535 RepID=A0AA40DHC9_9PEZI|nr:hypothetical protein QBC41DRAFT_392823 [Cercophora samala]
MPPTLPRILTLTSRALFKSPYLLSYPRLNPFNYKSTITRSLSLTTPLLAPPLNPLKNNKPPPSPTPCPNKGTWCRCPQCLATIQSTPCTLCKTNLATRQVQLRSPQGAAVPAVYHPICEPCFLDQLAQPPKSQAEKQQQRLARLEEFDRTIAKMLSRVRAMDGEKVPIRYAVDRLMDAVQPQQQPPPHSNYIRNLSIRHQIRLQTRPLLSRSPRWWHALLREKLAPELGIAKAPGGKRWVCVRERADEINFRVWFLWIQKYEALYPDDIRYEALYPDDVAKEVGPRDCYYTDEEKGELDDDDRIGRERDGEGHRKERARKHDEEVKKEHRQQRLLDSLVAQMLKNIAQTPGCEEKVPIKYAVDRLMTQAHSLRTWDRRSRNPRWWHAFLREKLSDELGVTKVGSRWVCDKERVDKMDFKMWYFSHRLLLLRYHDEYAKEIGLWVDYGDADSEITKLVKSKHH